MKFSVQKIEQQLSGYSIWEFRSDDTKAEILSALQQGKIKELTFQKNFVPADEIDQYWIVGFQKVEDGLTDQIKFVPRLVESFLSYQDALKSYVDVVNEVSGKTTRELLLVGKYKAVELSIDQYDELDKTKWITLNYVLALSGSSFNLTSRRNPFDQHTINEKIKVQVDPGSDSGQSYDVARKVPIDEFWKKESVSKKLSISSDNDLLSKHRIANKNGFKL